MFPLPADFREGDAASRTGSRSPGSTAHPRARPEPPAMPAPHLPGAKSHAWL